MRIVHDRLLGYLLSGRVFCISDLGIAEAIATTNQMAPAPMSCLESLWSAVKSRITTTTLILPSARFSIRRRQSDMGWVYLRLFARVGLVENRYVAPRPVVASSKQQAAGRLRDSQGDRGQSPARDGNYAEK